MEKGKEYLNYQCQKCNNVFKMPHVERQATKINKNWDDKRKFNIANRRYSQVNDGKAELIGNVVPLTAESRPIIESFSAMIGNSSITPEFNVYHEVGELTIRISLANEIRVEDTRNNPREAFRKVSGMVLPLGWTVQFHTLVEPRPRERSNIENAVTRPAKKAKKSRKKKANAKEVPTLLQFKKRGA